MNHSHYMHIALEHAQSALEQGEFPVGCVIVANDEVIVSGARICSTNQETNELDHAEMVALCKLATLQNSYAQESLTCYCTMEPCLMCFGALLLNNISTIVYAYEDIMGGATKIDRTQLSPLYCKRDVTIIPHIGRNASLQLFKAFFSNPNNEYWQDSQLARYTLEQA
jgi:tRNA(adenine34) deaminase